MSMIGMEIAKMHQADIVHGDLTTSNMMLRRPSPEDPEDSRSCFSATELVTAL